MKASRYLRDAALFAPCYVALDWASYIDPIGLFNITPWNPQPALAIIWLMLGGLGNLPAVIVTIVASEFIVRQAPGGLAVTLPLGLLLGCCYALMAWSLRRAIHGAALRTTAQLTAFTGIVFAGAALISALFIGLLQQSGMIGGLPFLDAWLRFWIGDAVGILVTGPLLLAAADPRRRSGLAALQRRPEAWLQLLALCATLWLVFKGLDGDPATHFYLLFLPLIWIAIRSGLNGAIVATAIVQLGVVLVIHDNGVTISSLVELQTLVATLTLTGLFLGMMVDERERAEESLRQSLRLAAAGEMAGAIAHEINQPLTALANYGQSARMLIDRGQAAQLPEVLDKLLGEAARASGIVRRLRDFFRSGSTRLETVTVDELLRAAGRIGRQLIGERAIRLDISGGGDLQPLYVDRLQIEVVLRNLIANAVEALPADDSNGIIRIEAQAHGPREVCLSVIDSGPGVAPALRERLFSPFASGKPSGMGLGLAMSLAIAEAHGGSIQAGNAGRGEFRLILPCQQNN
jgi:signal transduction histidine kinase